MQASYQNLLALVDAHLGTARFYSAETRRDRRPILREADSRFMRPFCAALSTLLTKAVNVASDSSFCLAEMAARSFFSTVRTSPSVRLLIAFRRNDMRAFLIADL